MNDVIRELFIDKRHNKVRIALTENNKLVELQEENESDLFAVGDILLGRVKKYSLVLMPHLLMSVIVKMLFYNIMI